MAATGSVIGDVANYTAVQKEGVVLHNMPEVLESHLSDKDAVINQASVSGKRLGAVLVGTTRNANNVVTKATYFMAAGDEPTSKWIAVKQLVGAGVDITPA